MRSETVVAMRKAATLAFAVPGLEVDVRSAGELVARVQRRGDNVVPSSSTTLLAPCTFRTAVARMVLEGTGGRAVFCGLDAQAPIAIEYFMPFSGAAQPLGRLQSRVGETVVNVFATTQPLDVAAAVIADIGPHPSISARLACARDDATRITLVYCESRICDVPTSRPHVEAMIDAAFVRLGARDIVDELAALSRSGGPA